MPWRPRAAAARWLSDLRTVLAFLREHRGVPRAAHDRLAELARDKHVLVATRPPGATDGPPCAVTVIQPGGRHHLGARRLVRRRPPRRARGAAAGPRRGGPRRHGGARRRVAGGPARRKHLRAARDGGCRRRGLCPPGARVGVARRPLRAAWPFVLPPLLGLAIRSVVRLWLRRQPAHLDGQPVQRERQALNYQVIRPRWNRAESRHFPGRQPCGAVL